MTLVLGLASAIFALAAVFATTATAPNNRGNPLFLAAIITASVGVGTLLIGIAWYYWRRRTPKNELRAGQKNKLPVGRSLRSLPRGTFRLDLHEDGMLAIIRTDDGKPRWVTDTAGKEAGKEAKHLEMQKDGNLVLYARDGTSLWAADTDGQGGTRLVMQDDGNLVIRTDTGKPIWATDKAELRTGEKLTVGQSLRSRGDRFRLDLHEDGMLAVIRTDNDKHRWATDTAGKEAAYLEMQEDGNLVLYARDGTPLWATDTDGQGGKLLVMQSDGNLVIRTGTGKPVWATDKADLRAGEQLTVGQSLRSPGDRFRLDLHEDGMLAVIRTDDGKPRWATDTAGTGAKYLAMQKDGNLVLYARDGTPLWAAGTDGQGGKRLVMQGDGNLVIRANKGYAIWQSDTVTA